MAKVANEMRSESLDLLLIASPCWYTLKEIERRVEVFESVESVPCLSARSATKGDDRWAS